MFCLKMTPKKRIKKVCEGREGGFFLDNKSMRVNVCELMRN